MLASEEARRGVILSLVAVVAGTYIQLRGLDDQLEISQRTLDAYAESVRLFELQFAHGQISQMTVEQARSQYETAAATIPQIESQIAQTENALSILLARNPGPIERGKSIAELVPPAIPSGLPSQLLERRPDLAQAEQNLIAANAQIGAAKALYFPTISLTAAMGTQSSDLSNLFSGPSKTWSYAGSFTGPIFTAGAIAGQVKQAEAMQQAALEGYENAILERLQRCGKRTRVPPKALRPGKGSGGACSSAQRIRRAWPGCSTTGAIRLTSRCSTPRPSSFQPSSPIPRERPRCWQRLSTFTKPWEVDG